MIGEPCWALGDIYSEAAATKESSRKSFVSAGAQERWRLQYASLATFVNVVVCDFFKICFR